MIVENFSKNWSSNVTNESTPMSGNTDPVSVYRYNYLNTMYRSIKDSEFDEIDSKYSDLMKNASGDQDKVNQLMDMIEELGLTKVLSVLRNIEKNDRNTNQ